MDSTLFKLIFEGLAVSAISCGLLVSCKITSAQESTWPENNSQANLEIFFPEHDVRAYVLAYCVSCHDLLSVIVQHKDEAGWEASIRRMVGPMITDEILEDMTQYLAEYFGKENPITEFPIDLNSNAITVLQRIPTITAEYISAIREKNAIDSLTELGSIIGNDKLNFVSPYIYIR
jgi:hypothetical protein